MNKRLDIGESFKKFFLVILEILLIFSPEFNFFRQYTWCLAALGIVVFLLYFSNSQYSFNDKTSLNILYTLVVCFAWSLCVLIINGSNEFNYIVFQIGTTLTIFRNFLLVALIRNLCRKGKISNTEYYLNILNWACLIYVAFTLIFIAMPSFKEFWCNSIVSSEEVDYVAYQFRYSLNGFAAFASSTIFSIAILASAFLIAKNIKNKKVYKYLLFYIVNLVGCFFYGRICLIAVGVSGLYLVIILWRKKRFRKLLLIFILIACLLLMLLNGLAEANDTFKIWKGWAFSIIDGLLSKKGVTDYSVTHMFKDMYFMPSLKTLIIGDGMYIEESTGRYYMHTDVGFMRAILYFGVFGCLLNYALFFVFWNGIWKMTKADKQWRGFLVCFLLVFIVLEMKGEAFHRCAMIIMPLYYAFKYDKKILLRKPQ